MGPHRFSGTSRSPRRTPNLAFEFDSRVRLALRTARVRLALWPYSEFGGRARLSRRPAPPPADPGRARGRRTSTRSTGLASASL
eukprot:tig00021257_g19737.t1